MSGDLELGKELLDHQLIDCEERRCGNVDDLAFSGGVGEELRVAALLSGPGTWRQRLPRRAGRPAAWLLERLFGTGVTRVPWDDVAEHDGAVILGVRAADVGLGEGDDRLAPLLARFPGS